MQGSLLIEGTGGKSGTSYDFNRTVASHIHTDVILLHALPSNLGMVTNSMLHSTRAVPVCHSLMGFNTDLTVTTGQ